MHSTCKFMVLDVLRLFAVSVTPLVVVAGQLPNDNFRDSTLDSCRWSFNPSSTSARGGTYDIKNGLVLTSDGSRATSQAIVYTQYYAGSDFDVEVDYTLDGSWDEPIVPAGNNPLLLGAGLRVYFDAESTLTLARLRMTGAEQLLVSGTVSGEQFSASVPSSDRNGTLRIQRTGKRIAFMARSGDSWMTVGSWTGPVRPAVFGLISANVHAMNSVATTFRSFRIKSGTTSFKPYQLPSSPLPRHEFVPGFVSTDALVWIVWGGATGYDPFAIMSTHGIGRARIRATTVSNPRLEVTPFASWHTLPWDNSYWASLQVASQELIKANSLGMETYLELFLSDVAADAGRQDAPIAWKGLSVEDTATAVEAYTYDTASYLKRRGIRVALWSPGNEIGTGILNFRPGERLSMPSNASPYEAIEFMEQNVWPIEARLLKAAIAGIRRIDPEAKIVLHVAGLTLSPADLWVKAFFTNMVNLGVPFDVAGVSLPYMSPGWRLPEYTTACWYQRLNAAFTEISKLGKKGIISEGAYQNTTVHISANAPMPDFPLTPEGQASWINAVLRFASSNPNLLGFNYTFPDAYPGVPGLDSPPLDIQAFSLFKDAKTVQPGMLEFKLFLNAIKTPQVRAVVNLANSQPGPLAPGEYAIVYGENLAGLPMNAEHAPFLPVLANVSVTVNGVPAMLQYASSTQVNFLIPTITSSGPATVVVNAGLRDSKPFTVDVREAAPAIFTHNGDQAIAQNMPSLALNGPSSPAPPGSLVTVYVVGLGLTSPAVEDGTTSPTSPLASCRQKVTATVGGQDANVFFAGLTPEAIGLGQVNISVPLGVAAGKQSLIITVGAEASAPARLWVGSHQ